MKTFVGAGATASRARLAVLVVTLGGAIPAAAVAACSDDAVEMPSFDAAVDTGIEADLPPRSDPDGGAELDADASPLRPDGVDEPVACTVSPCAVELAAGNNHLCALMSDGTVQCWGQNLDAMTGMVSGVLGRGQEPDAGADAGPPSRTEAFAPARVVGLAGVRQLSASGDTSCARLADGTIQCWGCNDTGQLGLAAEPPHFDALPHPTPAPVALTGKALRVDLGTAGATACAVMESGTVQCWGSNDQLQLAREPASTVIGPGPADLHDVVRTSATIALTKDRRLLSWGDPSAMLLGRPSSVTTPTAIAMPIPTLEGVTAVHANRHACAIADGDLYCWGIGSAGRLCTGEAQPETLPRFIDLQRPAGAFAQQVTTTNEGTCVRLTDGTVQCCGQNGAGQLGLGDPDGGTSPMHSWELVPTTGLTGHAVRVVGTSTTRSSTLCALMKTGAVMCWGSNFAGGLGLGAIDSDPHPTPTPIVFQP